MVSFAQYILFDTKNCYGLIKFMIKVGYKEANQEEGRLRKSRKSILQ